MLEALKQTYAYLWENKYPSVTTDISNDVVRVRNLVEQAILSAESGNNNKGEQ
jgi:hypothetical protein